MRFSRHAVLPLMVAHGLLMAVSASAAEAPEAVSPGALDRVAAVRGDCPTFSWEAVDGASFYELLVYALPDDADLSAELALTADDEVLYTRLPGGATGWTPEVGRCFAPAGAYVWFVRAVVDEDGALENGEWSRGLFFTVAAPSAEEVRQALDVLQRYLASGEAGDRELAALLSGAGADGDAGSAPRSRRPTAKGTAPDTLTGAAAIRASMPDLTGATFGVYGTTNSTTDGSLGVVGEATGTSGEVHGIGGITASPAGAGVLAFNAADGPDLMLASETGGSAWLTETGLVRNVPGAVTFNFENSNASGSMTLQLDGVDVVTTLTDRDALGGLTCASGEVAKWSGSAWICDSDVDTDTLAALTCASGQLAKWNGSAWACAQDGDSLAALGCTAGQVAKWNGSAWACAADENNIYSNGFGLTLTGGAVFSVEPTLIQRRVVSPCPVGQSIRVVNQDGSVACEVDDDTTYVIGPGLLLDGDQIRIDPAAFSSRISTLDSAGIVGYHTSIAIGADGLGLISYYDSTNGYLKVAHCNDTACTSATTSTLDSAGEVGRFTSIEIGVDGLGLISYHDTTNGYLKVAHCNDTACTSATVATLDSSSNVGWYTSIAFGVDGLGLISYYDSTIGDLKVAHCNDTACTSAITSTLDSAGNVGLYTSIAIGADGLGLIAYYDATDNDLKAAHCNDKACASATTSTLDSVDVVGFDTSIAIGADGLGLISYWDVTNADLKVAHCNAAACTSATTFTIDSIDNVGAFTSIAIGADGRGLISYSDTTNADLKVAHCTDAACSTATTSTLDSTGFVGTDTSIAIGADGRGLVSYHDETNRDLKVVHLPYGL